MSLDKTVYSILPVYPAEKWVPKINKATCLELVRYMLPTALEYPLFHLHIIPMTLYKDIMPYFDKFINKFMFMVEI